MLELNLVDKRYADVIESIIGSRLTLFVAQNRQDYMAFMEEINDRQKRRISAMSLDGKTLNMFQPPISREELRSLGFDCWAIDQVKAPEPILVALCEMFSLHQFVCTPSTYLIAVS